MKNFIIFLIVYTVICKCSCTIIKSELQINNDSNTTTEQKDMQHSSLISRMKESIDSEYPQVIIYIPNNEDPLEVKQSPLKHIRNLLLSFFDRLIKKEIDFDDDYSLLNEVKRLNKVEVVPQNETDNEETSNIPKNNILQFFSNFENTLDENDVMEEVPNKCISCQNTKPYNNNHSCKRMSTTNAVENKLKNGDDSKKVPLNLTSKILPGLVINGKNLIATPETKRLVKRDQLVPKNGTFTYRKKLKRQSRKKVIQPTERFVTEFIDKNTKYFVGETNDANQDSTTNKFDDGKNKSKKPSIEEQKLAIKTEQLQSSQTVNISAKSNSTNTFLETHHFLLNSGGTANKSATASIVKNKSEQKFSIHKILSNIKTKRDLLLNRSKRNSNEIKTSVESRDKLPKVDEDRHPRFEFIKPTTAKKPEKRSESPVPSTAIPSSAVPSSAVPSSSVPSSAVPSTAVQTSSNTEKGTTSSAVSSTKSVTREEPSEGPEFDTSDKEKSLSQKPLLMIITVPTFLGIGAIILLLCFVTRDGGWCCKLFNIQYYKDPEANNYIAFR